MHALKLENSVDKVKYLGWDIGIVGQSWLIAFCKKMDKQGFSWVWDHYSWVLMYVPIDGITQTELVEKCAISKQLIQNAINHLEAHGLISREADPSDGRAKIIRLTDSGLKAMDAAGLIQEQLHVQMIRRYSKDEIEIVGRVLKDLAKNGWPIAENAPCEHQYFGLTTHKL